MDGPRTLGQIIRSRRQSLRLTQEELAVRIGGGVRQAEVSRLENDRITLPRRQRLERIAAALDLSLGELLASAGWTGADRAFEAEKPRITTPPIEETSPLPIHPVIRRGPSRLDRDDTERTKLQEAIAHSAELRTRTLILLEASSELASSWQRGRSPRPRRSDS